MFNSRFCKFCLLMLSLTFPLTSYSQAAGDVIPGEYIVKFKQQMPTSSVSGKISSKAVLKAAFPESNMYQISLKGGQESLVQDLQNDSDVLFVEPNYVLRIISEDLPGQVLQTLSADEVSAQASTSYTQSYAPTQVLSAWSQMAPPNSNKPIVAIIDTGLDSNHKVFKNTAAMWTNTAEVPNNGIDDDFNSYVDDVNGWNFINNTSNFFDDEGHGTHVGGIVVGAGFDIFSSSLDQSRIRVMPLKFLDANGSGSTANAVKAIYYAVDNGAKVINCSWGGPSYSKALHEAMTYAYDKKVMIVTAAGNSSLNNDSNAMYPANYDVPSNLSVAASTDSDALASFSNYGNGLVPVASPGVYIYSTLPGGGFGSMSGTSMAAPFVAGLAATAMREATKLTGYQIKQMILTTATKSNLLSGKVSTGSRINALNLIVSAKANASTNGSQPAYAANYQADRSVASSSSSQSVGGCGLVGSLASQIPFGGSSGGSAAAVLFVLTLPLFVWISLRKLNPAARREFDRFMMNTDIRVKVGERELVGHMKTISMGGLSFDINEALEKGGQVTMKIVGPDGKEIEVDGRIVWSEENKNYGVKFSEEKSSIAQSIQNWTSQLVKSSR
jgi:subtilisin family serine protease